MSEWFGTINLDHIIDRNELPSGEIILRASNCSFSVSAIDDDDKSVYFPAFRIPAHPLEALLTIELDCDEIRTTIEPILAWCAPQKWTEPCVPVCIRGTYPLRSNKENRLFFTRDGTTFWDLDNGKNGPMTLAEAIAEARQKLKAYRAKLAAPAP